MRYTFAKIIEKIARKDKKVVFMTGDLGYHAFEKLKDVMGKRFINAGVAEHNMVTAAAGMAYAGLKPWIYSIAPFVTVKVLEEIRNDVYLPGYNVKIVGLGGGYDYGIAGPTHHALADVAVMMTMPEMKIYTPGIAEDLEVIINKMNKEDKPSYLRLTKAEKLPLKVNSYQPLRRILRGNDLTVIALGSIINKVIPAALQFKNKLDVWLVSEMPLVLSGEFLQSIKKTNQICVIEEHGQSGGLGHHLTHLLREHEIPGKKFVHLFAKGYISHRYGSRNFYLKENKLDTQDITNVIANLV